MSKRILLKTKGENNKIRFVVTDDGEPVFHGVFCDDNIYSGVICSVRVKDRISAHKSVFCDAGQDRTAFIGDCDFMPGKMLLVQAESSEHETKGVKFSTEIKLHGKHLIAVIHQHNSKKVFEAKISRKINNEDLKSKLFKFISEYPMRKGFNPDCYCEIICRTSVAELTDFSILDDELDGIFCTWKDIYKKYSEEYEPNAKIGIIKGYADVIDYIIKHERSYDFDEIVTDCPILAHNLSERSPEFSKKIKCMSEKNEFDIFAVYNVDNKLCQLLRKQVYLKSGAYLVIEFTEAMTVVDVNSGKNTKCNAYDINCEAATEIMRQLRLRDIGGIIVCDFINMFDNKNEQKLVEFIKKLANDDPQELYISNVSHLGLLEMARRRS